MGSETVKCCREWAVTPSELGGVTLTYERDGCTWQIRTGMHCMWCGARFRLRPDGTVEVGPSEVALLRALANELSGNDCPGDDCDDNWQCPATPATHDCEAGPVELCWLIYYGLSATYEQAAALWARMNEAAKGDG